MCRCAGRLLTSFLFTLFIQGCDGSGSDFAPPTGSPPAVVHPLDGHFRGVGQLRDDEYYAEALLTVDGAVRIYLAGPVSPVYVQSGGVVPSELLISADAALFAGNIVPDGDEGSGSGLVFAIACDDAGADPFCETPAAASIEVTATETGFIAELRVATAGGEETWLLDVGEHSAWYEFAANGAPAGLYHETLARFALAGDVVLRIDDAGLLYFQGPDSGCTGNGTVSPHLDGRYSVWDVSLGIDNCIAAYAYLNGDFDGLATVSQSGTWDYDGWLIMFLTNSAGSSPRAGLMSHGQWP